MQSVRCLAAVVFAVDVGVSCLAMGAAPNEGGSWNAPRPVAADRAGSDPGDTDGLVDVLGAAFHEAEHCPSPRLANIPDIATPKVAAVYFTPMARAAERALAAKFQLTLVAFYAGEKKSRIQRYVRAIRACNPNIRLGSYAVLTEYRAKTAPHDADRVLVQALDENDWWARDANTGRRVQWTDGYGTWATNPTDRVKADPSGRLWPQVKADFDTEHIFGGIEGLDYIYIDQVNPTPWVAADYLHTGRNQAIDDPVLDRAYRRGMVDYWTSLRALNPDKKLIVNAGTLSTVEFDRQVEGAIMECQIGKDWSYETQMGWGAALQRYRAEMAETRAPHDVIYQVCGPTADPALMRYGLATAMLDDGYFAFTLYADVAPPWFDEYDAPIGVPIENPPTAPTPSGIWVRHYANGLVLVNPSRTAAASIDVGDDYVHLSGPQDPLINNGLPERMVTLQPRSGLLMIKRAR
jgi:hypothetical protein